MNSHLKNLLVALDFRESSTALCNEAILIAKGAQTRNLDC